MEGFKLGPIGFRLAHELEGIIAGIAADGVIHPLEQQRLEAWIRANAEYRGVRPFSEIVSRLEVALSDGVLSLDECEDLLFVARKYTTVNPHFDALRTGVQVLLGLLTGITADRSVNEAEWEALSTWVDEWGHLAGIWPYDECNAIVTAALGGTVLPTHVEQLRALASQFPVAGSSPSGERIPPLVGGICAVDPSITFRDRTFVFTGESGRGTRDELAALVITLGGAEEPNVTRRSDYLVVCAAGSDAWAYSCYGRKVEKAYNQRRSGHHVLIVHERDFWDALYGHGVRLG